MQKEDYLMKQIDEFREKAKQLQTMLTSREDKISELEEVVTEREESAGTGFSSEGEKRRSG